jgi:hypothetical protein
MKKLFITAALFLATTSAYAGNGCAHDSPRSNYKSSVSNDESTSSSYDSRRRSNYKSSRSDDSPRPRYNSAASNYGSNDESQSSSYDSRRSNDNSSSSSNDSPRSNYVSPRSNDNSSASNDNSPSSNKGATEATALIEAMMQTLASMRNQPRANSR